MKKIMTLILIGAACSANAQHLELRDGLYYESEKLYTGTYKEFFPGGNIMSETLVVEGKLSGETVLYYETGTRKEIRSYSDGRKNGVWYTFNEQGVKTAEAGYADDLKDGKWFIWDDAGRKRYEMQYTKGEKTATWYMWDEDGKLIMEKTY